MTVTTLPSHKFEQDISGAKRAAKSGPVIITDDGKPVYVLMSHDSYRRLLGPTLREMVAQPEGDNIDFDPPRVSNNIFRPGERS
jgi:PHD/YefM family antitoxin component YafN of YafNO toxin-antitoxin module